MQTVYASSLENGRLVSYDVSTLQSTGSIESFGHCEGKPSGYNMISNREPYYVMSGAFGKTGGCGMSLSLDGKGSLKGGAKSWPLEDTSTVHGFQFWDIEGTQLLYTADMGTDLIWTHAVDKFGGVTEIDRMKFSKPKVQPRFIQIHPNGRYMYVVLEHDNSVTALHMSNSGAISEDKDEVPFSLIPEGNGTRPRE